MAVHWLKSQSPWKLNVDGSSRDNLGPAGCGIVIRDSMGVVFRAEAYSIRSYTSVYAEAIALLRGLQLCSEHGLYRVSVETDSKLMF